MADNKVQMPITGAGLTRYFEDYKSKIAFQPEHIIVFGIIVMVLVILLHLFGARLLGI